MGSQPFYHLRPNKYVDRQIFSQILKSLNRNLCIKDYTYVGMGSYMFDDFKLLHNSVGIDNMISLETNDKIYKRALFNKPLKCIVLAQQSTSDYIANMDASTGHYIFWLDYTDPKEIGQQFDDFCRLISVLDEHDIIRITLNANPSSLGKPAETEINLWNYRLAELKNRIGDFVPTTITSEDMITKQYPFVLLSCLKKAYLDTVKDQDKEFLPLCTSVYDDNTQMLTLTGIIIKCKKDITLYKKNTDLKKYCNFLWDKPLKICMPALTPKEIIHISNELPTKSNGKLIEKKYSFVFSNDNDGLKSYLSFYKEYPNYHPVNF